MVRCISTERCLRLLPLLCGVFLVTLLAAPAAALAFAGSGPITWSPAASTYGVSETPPARRRRRPAPVRRR